MPAATPVTIFVRRTRPKGSAPAAEVALFSWPEGRRGETTWQWATETEPGVFVTELNVPTSEIWRCAAVARAPGHHEQRDMLDGWRYRPETQTPAPQVRAGVPVAMELSLRRGPTFAGQVVDECGKPVVGAQVRYFNTTHDSAIEPHLMRSELMEWPPPVTTDASGRFTWLSVLTERGWQHARNRWVLVVEHPDLVPALVQSPEIRKAEDHVVSLLIRLQAGQVVRGRVVDDAGQPVAHATVTAVPPERPDQPADVSLARTRQADERGWFTLPGLASRWHRLRAYAPGFQMSEVHAHPGWMRGDVPVRLREGWALDGQVLNARGQPMAGADLGFWPPPNTGYSLSTNGNGRFRADGLRPDRAVDVMGNATTHTVSPGGSPVVMRFADRVAMQFRVVADEDGLPLAQGVVISFAHGGTQHLDIGVDGLAQHMSMPPGHYEVTAVVPNRLVTKVELDLPASGWPAPFVVRVPRGADLAGRVTDIKGRPVADVEVTARGHRFAEYPSTHTDLDGQYRICGVDGHYGVVFRHPRFAVHLVPSVEVAPPSAVLDAQLVAGGTLTGQVIDSSGQPREGVLVRVLPDDYRQEPLPWQVTGRDGRYRLVGVPPGNPRVSFGARVQAIEIADREKQTLDLVVSEDEV